MRVRLFPYQFKIPEGYDKQEIFVKRFDIQNVRQNLMPYVFHSLVLVVDQEFGSFVCGRFLKLRRDTPAILNTTNGSERDISLLDNENIEEISHFIMNFKDNIILAEYNYQAIRHFSTPLAKYLEFIFKLDSVYIDVIPNIDTFKSMQSEKDFKSIRIKVAQSSLKRKENEVGISILGALKELALGGQTIIDIKISKGRGIDTDLPRKKVISYANDLKENIDLKILEIESSNASYDILNNNLLSYSCLVTERGKRVDRASFFKQAVILYDERIKFIKSCLKN